MRWWEVVPGGCMANRLEEDVCLVTRSLVLQKPLAIKKLKGRRKEAAVKGGNKTTSS